MCSAALGRGEEDGIFREKPPCLRCKKKGGSAEKISVRGKGEKKKKKKEKRLCIKSGRLVLQRGGGEGGGTVLASPGGEKGEGKKKMGARPYTWESFRLATTEERKGGRCVSLKRKGGGEKKRSPCSVTKENMQLDCLGERGRGPSHWKKRKVESLFQGGATAAVSRQGGGKHGG